MRAALALALVVVASACAEGGRPPGGAASGTDASAPPTRYLALGDSFTIGTGSALPRAFPMRLGERWRAQGCPIELRNVAVNGYTSDDLITEELPALTAFRPALVTVAIGANDIVQGHGLDAYRLNVRRILDAALATGARVVVLPQPDWSRSPAAAPFGTPATLGDAITRFNAALAEETRAKGATWVDLVPLMQTQAASGQLAGDGLHPSAEAYDAWAAELARVLPRPCGG
ncbi:MAG TPA: SGNH/GDSL hydrolase family protein [Labilithrix sp.]|nr:SGNH/GDSL hydrolase family protein [Labilithrix sp.]